MQACCNRIKVIWNPDHDAWCTKKLFLFLQEYTFMRQNILWLYDTKLEIRFSSGSVLETDPTSWPCTQGKVSLSNDKLFTSVKKQKYHAQSSRRAVTFISTLGYSGLKIKCILLCTIEESNPELLSTKFLLALTQYYAQWYCCAFTMPSDPITLTHFIIHTIFNSNSMPLHLVCKYLCYIKIYINEDIHV